jgi:iron complex outermembrane receptor protein
MNRLFTIILFFSAFQSLSAQDTDTTRVLHEVVIQAYQYDRPLSEIPASVGFAGQKELERFNNTSILPVVNAIPGVRMEERSPGSYRLSLRGSSLRSPFGVRNVKVYWNDLPFTDPGGNTYLNSLDFSSIQSLEVIKGPGSSLYGAGTGGVLLLRNAPKAGSGFEASTLAGSFGLFRYLLNAHTRSEQSGVSVQYTHQQSDGYREQTAMERKAIQIQADFGTPEESLLSANILYSDLLYETPGALTKAQFLENPEQARPRGGPNAGAVEQKATVYNKTFYAGFNHDYHWDKQWSTRTGVYGSFTDFDNPTIRNYERRVEHSFGGRTSTQYQFGKGKLNFGAEYQYGFSPVKVYDNNQGQSGALQTDDEITTKTWFVFSQLEFFLPADFFLTVGGSMNKLQVDFSRLSNVPPAEDERDFDLVFSPRIALLKKINSNFSVYGSFSQGYSPPTIQELYPSAGFFDQGLDPEKGNNIEVGLHSQLLKTISLHVAAYNFRLRQTIVNRRDTTQAGDPEYFINAGTTRQNGIEATLAWSPVGSLPSRISDLRVWVSYTRNDYTFSDYERDTIRYTGNSLTGVPPTTLTGGIDLWVDNGLYLNVTANYTDHIPLNDANSEFASDYFLLGARVGYKTKLGRSFPIEIFGGADNVLDKRYSLGNDLNAVGGRYYNAAPTRNFYAGLKIQGIFQKE